MIEFYDDEGVLGTVRVDDEELVADPVVQSFADGWLARGGSVDEFETYYDGWSNAYVSARLVEDEEATGGGRED